jgi:hypothetical protein
MYAVIVNFDDNGLEDFHFAEVSLQINGGELYGGLFVYVRGRILLYYNYVNTMKFRIIM